MKKYIKNTLVLLAFISISITSFGQSIFDKLENIEEVSSVIVNKDAFEILSKFKVDADDNEAIEIFTMIKELEELKMFSTKNTSIATQMEKMVQQTVVKNKLVALMRANDQNSRVKIYVKSTENKNFVSEVLLFIKDKNTEKGTPESIIVSLTGIIDMNKMSKIADTFSK
ncbi:DUF4252 domain-containing protein [Tenacibaculum piscium]|uniref:DUF4252 domain-containing protein n=1 Tax=Tenacibaculum piscium TaxID=1458515 RepID=A0A2H1YGW4_9FLAO|nr:DUF4252 domain-containing protein [Tenacibaculum piscium]SOS74744.1 conserved exported hypothetical protein [Tenacibaculum piscium]